MSTSEPTSVFVGHSKWILTLVIVALGVGGWVFHKNSIETEKERAEIEKRIIAKEGLRKEHEQTLQLQQAMLERMLLERDIVRADQLRQHFLDAEGYRRLLVLELAPQFHLSAEQAERQLRQKADAAQRDSALDVKDKAHQLLVTGRFEEAINLLNQAILETSRPVRDLLAANGDAFYAAFKLDSAAKAYKQAANLSDKTTTPLEWADANESLAIVYYKKKFYPEALFLFEEIVKIREMKLESKSSQKITALNNLALLLQNTKGPADAERLLRRVIDITEKSYGKDHPEVAMALNSLAGLLRSTNRFTEAEPLMRRALSIDENPSLQTTPISPETSSTSPSCFGPPVGSPRQRFLCTALSI